MQLPPLSLYIHLPWCIRKCPYCDFNSHELKGSVPERDYITALIKDFSEELEFVQNRQIASVFIGGGTPSLFSADAIAHLLNDLGQLTPFRTDAEITLEANPGTIEAEKFKEFRQAGVNRLSIGIQSFQDNQLLILGRVHNRSQAIRAAKIAHTAGFENFNLDLMFGLPGQSVKDAIDDVQTCIDLRPAHISYYQLTIEPNTFFYKHRPKLPHSETIWKIQQVGQQLLESEGFRQYEISAFSKPEYRCQHNLNYWQFGDYIGIGAGAHGKISTIKSKEITRYWKIKRPADYMQQVFYNRHLGGQSIVPKADLPFEFLLNNLRLREGFNESIFISRTGLPVSELEPMLGQCIGDRLLEKNYNNVRCTETGWNFLDEILQQFFPVDHEKHLDQSSFP